MTQSGRGSTLWTNGGGMNRRELSLCFTSPRDAGLAAAPYRLHEGGTMAGWAVSRRTVLGGCFLASGGVCSVAARADEPQDPDSLELPQPGDRLVGLGGEADKIPLKPGDIGSQDPVLAWAFDPQKKLPRDGSRLNMVLLMRFDPATLGDAEGRSRRWRRRLFRHLHASAVLGHRLAEVGTGAAVPMPSVPLSICATARRSSAGRRRGRCPRCR